MPIITDMKVYFVRHGESTAKRAGLEQTPETPLSAEGQKQAEAVAKRLADIKIDSVYSSTHLRAKETAEIISKNIGVSVEQWSHLVEADGGEAFDELNKRAEKILEHLISHHKDQTVVCVSHATMIEAIVAKMVFGGDLSPAIMAHIKAHFGTTNTGISIAEFDHKSGWTLLSFNDFGHL